MAKIVLTPEIREQMAGMLPMCNDAIYRHTPDMFKKFDVKFQPVFSLRQYDKAEENEIKRIGFELANLNISLAYTKKKSDREKIHKTIETVNERNKELAICIVQGWTNLFEFTSGKPFEYSEINTKALPNNLLTDIFTKGCKISGFAPIEEEKKEDKKEPKKKNKK